MKVLVATPSGVRKDYYLEALPSDLVISFASNGVECLTKLRAWNPKLLILESDLLWGGAEGVLAIRESDPVLRTIGVVLVARGIRFDEMYRISRYAINDYLTSDQSLVNRIGWIAKRLEPTDLVAH